MANAEKELPYLDFGNAPELFANDVREIQIVGQFVRFTFVTERMHNGEQAAVATFHVMMPLDRVPGAWAMTGRIVGGHVRLPELSRRYFEGDGGHCWGNC